MLFFLVGLLFYGVFVFIDYTLYRYAWKYLYFLGAVLLLITDFFAEFRSGAARWLSVGQASFQTSEIAKLFLIIAVASFVVENKGSLNNIKNVLLVSFLTLTYVILILVQPDLGSSIVVLLVTAGIMFYGGFSKLYMLVGIFVTGIFSTPLWHLLKDYQKERILVFLNPQLDVLGSGYNVIQSLIAVGSGGLTGKGFGQGTQANLQFLPAYWTDFIFASFSEEWGFVGVFLFISIYTLMLYFFLRIISEIEDLFGKLLCVGIFMMYFSQFTINVGMNLGILPVTGVTLPLVSYGGSSILISLVSLGIVQNIWVKSRP